MSPAIRASGPAQERPGRAGGAVKGRLESLAIETRRDRAFKPGVPDGTASGCVDGAGADDFVVDYVRVWQRDDLASDVDGYMPQSSQTAP